MPIAPRRFHLLLPTLLVVSLAACDGEEVVYDSERYETLWTRMAGDIDPDAAGVYGSLGVPATTNHPGARNGARSWTDSTGKVWLFGGFGRDANGDTGSLNDLWTWNPATSEWTWIKGSSLKDGAAVYGTQGTADVANTPGGRTEAVGWIDDNDDLWVFGGTGLDAAATSGRLNDLWKFDGTDWTWVGGSDTTANGGLGQYGVYGTKGTADPANWPGSRYQAAGWVDDDGKFWLFGGNGLATSNGSWLNDLWKYDPATTQWTWVKGSSSANATAVYETAAAVADNPATTGVDESKPAVTDADLTPGARYGMASWHLADLEPTDTTDTETSWIFGGYGNDSAGNGVRFNELWRFDGTHWLFGRGTKGDFTAGSYGGRGVFALTNDPPGRSRPVTWVIGSTLWMFGGEVEAADDLPDTYKTNDLWRFDSVGWTWASGTNYALADAPGTYPDALGGQGQPAGRAGGVGWVDADDNLWLLGGGSRDDLWQYQP